MKVFQNQSTKMLRMHTIEPYDFKGLCEECLLFVHPSAGMKASEMYDNFKVLDAVKACGDEIILEDSQHAILLRKVNEMIWTIQHKDILTFTDAVKEAKKYEPMKVEAKESPAAEAKSE